MASFHSECLVTSWKFQLTISVGLSIPLLQQWVGWAKAIPNTNSLHIAKFITNKLYFRKESPIPASWWHRKEVINQKSQSFPTWFVCCDFSMGSVSSLQCGCGLSSFLNNQNCIFFFSFFCTDDIKLVYYLNSTFSDYLSYLFYA